MTMRKDNNKGRPGPRYRMPTVFGASAGPRGDCAGNPYDYSDAPRTVASVSFLTEAAALSRLLPEGFKLYGEPVLTVEFTQLTELPWLAGRGYNILMVRFGAEFEGRDDRANGAFLPVLWENSPEAILTGREELGYAKLYCELPDARVLPGQREQIASWDSHTFVRMQMQDLQDAVPPESAPFDVNKGVMHWRYLPKVSAPGEAEVAQAVLTPAGGYPIRYESFKRGTGSVSFARTTWAQMPTMFHIVNALAELPQYEPRGALCMLTRGAKDISDQRVLR